MVYIIPLICITLNTLTVGYCPTPQDYDTTQVENAVAEYKRLYPPTRNANGDFIIPTDSRENTIIE